MEVTRRTVKLVSCGTKKEGAITLCLEQRVSGYFVQMCVFTLRCSLSLSLSTI